MTTDYTPGPLPEPAAIAWMYPEGRPCTLSWAGRDEERMSEMRASRGLVRVELVARAEVAREVAAAVAKERKQWRELVGQLTACHEDDSCPAVRWGRAVLAQNISPHQWQPVDEQGATPKEPT